MARTVFFGSSDSVFSNRHFRALLESDARIVAVVDVPPEKRSSTNSARPEGGSFADVAGTCNIPLFQPARTLDPRFIDELRALEPDLFIAVGYMLLLGPAALSVPRVVAANFHASLLPAYRGKHPVFWALRNGEQWCGLTVHEMAEGLDTGDILYQVRVPVMPSDSVATLYARIMEASVPLVRSLVTDVDRGNLPRRPQPAEGGSYHGATTEGDFRIQWGMEPALISRWVTATPGQCFMQVGPDRLFLLDARPVPLVGADSAPGTVLELGAQGCRVATTGGAVEMSRVRLADGGEQGAYEALAMRGVHVGRILGGS